MKENFIKNTKSSWLIQAQSDLNQTRQLFKNHNLLDLQASLPFEIWPENSNQDLNQDQNKIIKTKKAVVLIHGFLGTPYFMKSLASIYAAQGFYCYAPTLPGHGVCPQALKNIGLLDILKFLNNTLDQIQTQFEEVHLCGFSLGALLALLLTRTRKKTIQSITLLAPPLGITKFSKLIPPLSKMGFSQMPYPSAASLNGLKNPAMYSWHPLSAALTILDGMKIIHDNPSAWNNIPIFLIASYSDGVVKLQPLLDFFAQNNTHPKSKLRLYAPEKFPLSNLNKITLIPENTLGPHIKNLSHIGLAISPEDPWLGVDSPQYQNLPKHYFLAEKLPIHLFQKNIFRIFYNPDFKNLAQDLTAFLISDSKAAFKAVGDQP